MIIFDDNSDDIYESVIYRPYHPVISLGQFTQRYHTHHLCHAIAGDIFKFSKSQKNQTLDHLLVNKFNKKE